MGTDAGPRALPVGRVGPLLLSVLAVACSGEAPDSAASAPNPTASVETNPLADSLSAWYALGIGAHHLCSGLWVVDNGRTPEQVIAEDVSRFPAFRWEADVTATAESGVVSVSRPGVGTRTAIHMGSQGCAILPAGAEDPFFAPRATESSLPPPGEQDWPMGDRGAFGTFPEVDMAALDGALDRAMDDTQQEVAQNTRGLVVVYRGRILAERYADGWGPYTPQISWSMGKSIASALTGVLIQQGEFALDDPAPIPQWHGPEDPRRNVTVRDLLQMSSGLDFDNFGLDPDRSYLAANEHFRIYFDALDVEAHAIHQPLRFEPGSVWRYRNSDPLSLMAIARGVVEGRGQDFLSFPRTDLFDRVGMRSMVLETDAWGNFIVTGYDYGGSRDWARFGLLHLQDGIWEGQRILPEGWSEVVSTPAPGDPSQGYGGLFWVNRGGSMDRVPPDAYWAAGYMGQRTLIVPSRDVVIVRHGPSPDRFGEYFNRVAGEVLDAIGPRQ